MEQWRFLVIVACMVVSLFFTLVSTTGVLRLPDLYTRAHTASQADTLGAGFALAGVALALGVQVTAAKTVLLLFFIFVTNPTAAHAIARAADEEGIEHWTVDDDRSATDIVDAAGGEPAIGASLGGSAAGEQRDPSTDTPLDDVGSDDAIEGASSSDPEDDADRNAAADATGPVTADDDDAPDDGDAA